MLKNQQATKYEKLACNAEHYTTVELSEVCEMINCGSQEYK